MDSKDLAEIQAALKQQYKDDPSSGLVTMLATGRAGASQGLSCNVDTVNGLLAVGPHSAMGGDGSLACAGDMLLQSLVACSGITLRAVAAAMELTLNDAVITAEGDVDFRGMSAVTEDVPVGFKSLRLQFALDTDATQEQQDMLIRLTERYCVVLQTLRPTITVTHKT